MKLKFWQFEYDFDKEDAKIVVPLILLLIAISTINSISPVFLIGLTSIYYLLYFFSASAIKGVIKCIPPRTLKCPSCKNKKIILQGYQGYMSDEQYPYYFCTACKTTSILTDGGLLEV